MRADPITFTREELYELVWTTPVRQLAARYGISDGGLAKICNKHRIPRPPRGHWARLQHGKRVQRVPLPRLADESLRTIVIEPWNPTQSPVERPERLVIPVASVLSDLHPMVEATAKSLRGARADEDGLLHARDALDVLVGPESVERAMRVMDALIKAIEEKGGRVTSREGQAVAEVAGEPLAFRMCEGLLRKPKELTAAQKRHE